MGGLQLVWSKTNRIGDTKYDILCSFVATGVVHNHQGEIWAHPRSYQ